MLQFQLTPVGLGRVSFGYSPLAEATSSVRALASGHLADHHQPWYDDIRGKLGRLDWTALTIAAPYRHVVPGFMNTGVQGPDTSVRRQLRLIASMSAHDVAADVRRSWNGEPLPEVGRCLIADQACAQRIATALWDYWVVALEPYWTYIQSALDDDLSKRLQLITTAGLECVLPTLDSRLQHIGERLIVHKKDEGITDVTDSGMSLVPSVFVWPHLAVTNDPTPQPSVIYAAHNARRVWSSYGRPAAGPTAALGALIGVSRATILHRVDLCHTTAALARDLDMSRPAVSQHLTLLKRSGMVQARRFGKRVVYQRTTVGDELIAASANNGAGDALLESSSPGN